MPETPNAQYPDQNAPSPNQNPSGGYNTPADAYPAQDNAGAGDAYVGENLWEAQAPIPPSAVRPVTPGAAAPQPGASGTFTAQDEGAVSAYKALEARRQRKRRKRIIAGSIAGVLALGGLGLWAVSAMRGPAGQEEVQMDLGVAITDTFETSVGASGAIKPASQVVVTPEVEGIIQEVRVAEGDVVSKGDVLFILKNDSLDKAVQDAQQALKSAQNGVTSAQNALSSAYGTLSNAQSHYNTVFSTGYETQEEADAAGQEASDALSAAQTGVSDAELAVENAEIAVTTAQEALDQARATADKRTVTAPEGGAIVSMKAEVGASVGTAGGSEGSSLITIADLSTLTVSVQVNEVDINNLEEGQSAEVTFSALPDLTLDAQVQHIAAISSGAGDEGMGGIVTYEVDLVIPEPDPRVKPGMTARVKIVTQLIENALTVPSAALTMIDEANAIVSVVVDNDATGSNPIFEEREVSVVAKNESMAVVEGNIADGDEVALTYDEFGLEEGDLDVSVDVG